MELLKVYAALLRRKWIFLQAVLFFTVGACVLALVLPKRYQATAKLSVESSSAELSILGEMDLGEMASSLSGSSDDMQTKISLAQMRPVLDEVVWRLQLRDTDGELLVAEKLLVPGIDGELLAQPYVEITQAQGTNILLFTANANTPELSALLADTIVTVYLEVTMDTAKQDTRDALKFVQSELDKLQSEFDVALQRVSEALRAEQVIDLDAETKAAVGRASSLVGEIVTADAEMADLQAQIRQIQRGNDAESVALVSPGSIATNIQVRELRGKLTEVRLSRQSQLLDKTPKHPDILDLDRQIASIEAEITLALREQHELDPAVEGLQVQYAGLLMRRGELVSAVQSTVAEAGTFPEKGRKLAELQLTADATETIYKSLLEQQYQIAVAEAMTVSDMKSVEPAKAPDRAAEPKLLVYLVLGGIVGIGMGFGLVFLLEYVDDSITSGDDIRLAWALPVLGLVPAYKLKGPTQLIHGLPPTDPLFESYRAIRNSIAFAGVDSPIDILTVTSSIPGEGKSTFCTNLAICLANDGKRVVVVDCDLRRPTQHKSFPTLGNDRGVSSVLSQTMLLADAVQSTPIANLAILTSGPLPNNPGRLVESLRLRQMLQELARSFDMVLVDAPPILAVGDALNLGRASKGTIIVVESGRTTRRMLSDLRGRIEGSGFEPIGIVLNKVDPRNSGYGNYRAYTRLYSQRQADVEGPRAKGA
ncbi:MAG: polysaccharide biosynthesis tyrosine autokinase [Pseudomonadota bacterium]|nr:polysaccharide biosynthesis tyrosine autokinase [Pseudomonadota bacterium]